LLEAQADSGNAEAQYLLAELLATLRRAPEDEPAAVQWLQRAAAGGHADAQFALAARYERGQGVTADDAEAVTWYRAAARQGHAAARERLRAIYREAGLPLPVEVEAPPPVGSGARWPSGHWPLVQIDEAPEYRPCTRHASSSRVA
jgi:TPR repeat protein